MALNLGQRGKLANVSLTLILVVQRFQLNVQVAGLGGQQPDDGAGRLVGALSGNWSQLTDEHCVTLTAGVD